MSAPCFTKDGFIKDSDLLHLPFYKAALSSLISHITFCISREVKVVKNRFLVLNLRFRNKFYDLNSGKHFMVTEDKIKIEDKKVTSNDFNSERKLKYRR